MKKNTFTVPAPMAEAAHRKAERRNLWTYPVGTVGRDMIYQLFTNYILTYTLFTRELTAAQLAAMMRSMIRSWATSSKARERASANSSPGFSPA